MKQLLTGLATCGLLFVALFSTPTFAANAEVAPTLAEDEALHCKTTFPDGTSSECWFCKCPMTQPQAPQVPGPADEA